MPSDPYLEGILNHIDRIEDSEEKALAKVQDWCKRMRKNPFSGESVNTKYAVVGMRKNRGLCRVVLLSGVSGQTMLTGLTWLDVANQIDAVMADPNVWR